MATTSTDYNKRAAVGQAYNLAVHDAIHAGEATNPKYIYRRFVYYHTLGDAIQSADLELIQEVIDNKDFDQVIKDLKEALK